MLRQSLHWQEFGGGHDVSTPRFADGALPRNTRRARAWDRKEFEIVGCIERGMLRWRHSSLPT